jgi:hypothetical protein
MHWSSSDTNTSFLFDVLESLQDSLHEQPADPTGTSTGLLSQTIGWSPWNLYSIPLKNNRQISLKPLQDSLHEQPSDPTGTSTGLLSRTTGRSLWNLYRIPFKNNRQIPLDLLQDSFHEQPADHPGTSTGFPLKTTGRSHWIFYRTPFTNNRQITLKPLQDSLHEQPAAPTVCKRRGHHKHTDNSPLTNSNFQRANMTTLSAVIRQSFEVANCSSKDSFGDLSSLNLKGTVSLVRFRNTKKQKHDYEANMLRWPKRSELRFVYLVPGTYRTSWRNVKTDCVTRMCY